MKDDIKKIVIKLATVSVFMFGFGYLLVPIYDVLCDITGLNGKTGTISVASVDAMNIDKSRVITVTFDTNVNSKLPWKFNAGKKKLQLHPGEIGEATFNVTNLASSQTYGQAIPSVSPSRGAVFFNKTECFCFSRQGLRPNEYKEMTVRFVVDPALPESIRTLTLSYTFFSVPGEADQLANGSQPVFPAHKNGRIL